MSLPSADRPSSLTSKTSSATLVSDARSAISVSGRTLNSKASGSQEDSPAVDQSTVRQLDLSHQANAEVFRRHLVQNYNRYHWPLNLRFDDQDALPPPTRLAADSPQQNEEVAPQVSPPSRSRWAFPRRRKLLTHRVVFVGDAGVGKLALIRTFIQQQFTKRYLPAIKAEYYRKLAVVDEVACMIELLEISDLKPDQGLRNQVLQDAEAFVLVYDINNRPSFSSIPSLRTQIFGAKKTLHPIVLIGVDLGGDLKPAQREVSHREAAGTAQAQHCGELTEMTPTNYNVIEKVIFDLVRTLRRQKNLPPVCCEPCQCEHGATI